jgi:hypothetical protein
METVEQIYALCTSTSPPLKPYTNADLDRRKAVLRLVFTFKISDWRESVSQVVSHSSQTDHVWCVDGTLAGPPLVLAALDEWHAWALSQGPDSPYREVHHNAPARNTPPRR